MLKEKLELCVERLRDVEEAQRAHSLNEIKKEVAGATSSMTSVPKPLKFLSKQYKALKELYAGLPHSDFKVGTSLLTKFYRPTLPTYCQFLVWLLVMKAPMRA